VDNKDRQKLAAQIGLWKYLQKPKLELNLMFWDKLNGKFDSHIENEVSNFLDTQTFELNNVIQNNFGGPYL